MIIESTSIPRDEVISTDVAIVGAGPAGLTLAWELVRRGLAVCVLESGPISGGMRTREEDDTAVNVGLPYRIAGSRGWGFAGTATTWRVVTPAGPAFVRLRELDAIDFESRDWVPESGWPFTASDLEGAYRRARRLLGLPADELGATGDEAGGAAEDAPWTKNGIVTRPFVFAPRNVYTYWAQQQLSRLARVRVVTGATVIDIAMDTEPGDVTGLRVAGGATHRFTVRARRYVLAAGAIQNARLLLASRGRFPEGIGNRHGLVGRYFMEHPHYLSGFLVPSDRALLGRRELFEIHQRLGVVIQRKYSLPEATLREERLLGCVVQLEPTPWTAALIGVRDGWFDAAGLEAARTLRHRLDDPARIRPLLTEVALDAPRLVRHVATKLSARLGRQAGIPGFTRPQLLQLGAMAEQEPNPDSRVRLGRKLDRFGLPVAELDWRLTRRDLENMRRHQELIGRALEASGAGRVYSAVNGRDLPPHLNPGPHHMGTTRMHPDPRHGVVDADGRVHGTQNLHVAGGSVFPTVGYANPALTIIALAFRLADHLAGVARGA